MWESYKPRFAPETIEVASKLTDVMFSKMLK